MHIERLVSRDVNEGLWSEARKAVVRAMEKLDEQGVRVYKTYTRNEHNRGIVFVSTSKDIHLWFGRLESKTLLDFGELLNEMFDSGKRTQILLLRGDGVLITRTESLDEIQYTFSPAH